MLFLNMSSTAEKTLNKIVGEKNGTQIVLYGHMDERHKDRLNVLMQSKRLVNQLTKSGMKKLCLEMIDKHYDELMNNVNELRAIRGNIKLKNKGMVVWAEIAIQVRACEVCWMEGEDKIVAKDYVDYVKDGRIKIGDTVITIETFATSVKAEHELHLVKSFTEIQTLDTIKFEERFINVTVEQFKTMFKNWTVTPFVHDNYFPLVKLMN